MGIEKKTLPQLPELITPVGTDLLHINSGSVDKKIQLQNLGGGKLVNVASSFSSTNLSGFSSATVSVSNTTILANRGIQLHSLPYTASQTGNLIVVTGYGTISFTTTSSRLFMLLTASTESAVIGAQEGWAEITGNAPHAFSVFAVYTAPSTSSITYAIRGASSNATQISINGISGFPLYGSTNMIGIKIEEFKP